jgi:anaerobic magnesium-protoporphyrin IX monomethyl ester cyclase
MKRHTVVFIAQMDYDNLGIGYLAALLKESGYKTRIISAGDNRKKILRKLKSINPLLVGFSIIYQYNIDLFADLISYLRSTGVNCHFTAGGHYASLKYEELLGLIPMLDSVVRYEGEYTVCELVECLSSGIDWRKTKSLVYKSGDKLITNPLRPLEADLDRFPFPLRTRIADYALGEKFATIIAGRGCIHNCSFCNIKEYYRPFPGQSRRLRRPELVVDEMEYLNRKEKCSVFLFQDDDFPVRVKNKSFWIERFCDELKSRGLSRKIMWKINCRADEIDEEHFALMKSNGLFLVFIGIEDGTDSGLKRLNKNMTVTECLKGIDVLKKLKIGFDYGFLLFQPETSFSSLYENLDFLNALCGDGYSPVTLLKMMPYYETKIEKELMAAGRITGAPGHKDYEFHEEAMNRYYGFITKCFSEWTRSNDGLTNISKWARNYISVCERLLGSTPALPAIKKDLGKIISECNLFFIDRMKKLAVLYESGNSENDIRKYLKAYRREIKSRHEHYKKQINSTITNLIMFSDLMKTMTHSREPLTV